MWHNAPLDGVRSLQLERCVRWSCLASAARTPEPAVQAAAELVYWLVSTAAVEAAVQDTTALPAHAPLGDPIDRAAAFAAALGVLARQPPHPAELVAERTQEMHTLLDGVAVLGRGERRVSVSQRGVVVHVCLTLLLFTQLLLAAGLASGVIPVALASHR